MAAMANTATQFGFPFREGMGISPEKTTGTTTNPTTMPSARYRKMRERVGLVDLNKRNNPPMRLPTKAARKRGLRRQREVFSEKDNCSSTISKVCNSKLLVPA